MSRDKKVHGMRDRMGWYVVVTETSGGQGYTEDQAEFEGGYWKQAVAYYMEWAENLIELVENSTDPLSYTITLWLGRGKMSEPICKTKVQTKAFEKLP